MASWPEFRPSRILARLAAGGVDFLVIGGYAAIAHGSAQQTNDLDVCFARDEENLRALARVLEDLGARLREIEESVSFVPDARVLLKTELLTLDTSEGPLDLVANPEGAPDYATMRRRATRVDVAGVAVLVASLDDLKEMKRAVGRDKDRIAVEELEAIEDLNRRAWRARRASDG